MNTQTLSQQPHAMMDTTTDEKIPLVSVAVACRNEEKYIGSFLEAIRAQTYPLDRVEVVIADGLSIDKTREIVSEFKRQYPEVRVRLVDNPQQVTPTGFNAAIRAAAGDFILPIGAHSALGADYIRGCVDFLQRFPDADVVGGSLRTLPSGQHLMAVAIAESLSHPFGTGNAAFRLGVTEPKWVDTVFGGCYRRHVLEHVGLYHPELLRSQDLELNLRIKQAGYRMLLAPGLEMKYYPKSRWWDIARYYFRAGIWVSWSRRFTSVNYRLRQYLPMFAVITGIVLVGLAVLFPPLRLAVGILFGVYLLLNLWFSFQVAKRHRRWGLLAALPLAFSTRHVMFGTGSLVGMVLLLGASCFLSPPPQHDLSLSVRRQSV